MQNDIKNREDITVREWAFTDNAQIAQMEKLYFPDPWNLTMLADTFIQHNFIGFVAEKDGKVVGYVGANYCIDECEIALVCVDKGERRKGIATILLQTLEDKLKSLSVERILLEVRRSNISAQKCYINFGFSVLTVRAKYYQNTEDALIMEKYV